MPRRSLSQTSFYDPEVVQPNCLEPATIPWLLARFGSLLFPAWLFEGWRGEGRKGREAWPAKTLITLLFLRWSEEGISRLGSTKRAKTDVSWRAALGLHMQTQVPDEKTLREFEAFLRQRHPRYDSPRFLLIHEHIVRCCINASVVGKEPIWTTDSTPMWCYGAVMDTVRLIGDGTRMLAVRWAKATGQSLEQVAETWDVPYILAKSIKGYFSIDWNISQQRAQLVETLASGALRAVDWVRSDLEKALPNRRRRLLRRCRNLLRIVEQDIETDEQGRLVIAKKVAKDRIISLTDPSARHGRKSKSHTFNGFKVHILGDIVSGLIAAVTVTAGNKHDGSVTHRLIRRAKALNATIDVILGDTAYGSATLRHTVKNELNVKLITPPPPVTNRSDGAFSRSDFDINFENNTSTCPNGIKAERHERVFSKEHKCQISVFHWSNAQCAACPFHTQCCGKRKGGRRIFLHPHEKELRQARTEWQEPQIRKFYRRRSQCERLVNQMVRHGCRRARGWGLGSAQLQAHLIAMRCNLQLLARAFAQL